MYQMLKPLAMTMWLFHRGLNKVFCTITYGCEAFLHILRYTYNTCRNDTNGVSMLLQNVMSPNWPPWIICWTYGEECRSFNATWHLWIQLSHIFHVYLTLSLWQTYHKIQKQLAVSLAQANLSPFYMKLAVLVLQLLLTPSFKQLHVHMVTISYYRAVEIFP